jgi:hypothetical protein
MSTKREQFLAGDRPDDVAIYFADEHLENREALADHAEAVEGGLVLVVPGDRGRDVFAKAVGADAMNFARTAMGREGSIDPGLGGGTCPEGNGTEHRARFVFAFAEEENEEAGGLYAEGDVIHAYARCSCDASYSDRWVAD